MLKKCRKDNSSVTFFLFAHLHKETLISLHVFWNGERTPLNRLAFRSSHRCHKIAWTNTLHTNFPTLLSGWARLAWTNTLHIYITSQTLLLMYPHKLQTLQNKRIKTISHFFSRLSSQNLLVSEKIHSNKNEETPACGLFQMTLTLTLSMKPNQPQKARRRPDLSIPLPQPNTSLALPLPLPPPGGSSAHHSHPLSFDELDKERRIGSGNGGTVYKVRHRPTGKSYALKVIYGNHEDSVRLQICREIEILRTVDDPNVVKCHGMFDNNGEIQVLLELMDCGSLEGKKICHEPSLADFTRQILSGLSYLHSRKIVHRDIKPSNLLINSRKQVKIADFGVSRILAQTMDPNCNSSVGTIAYMSPERINTDLNDGVYHGYAGDIWSLGVSVLEFYLGRFPFAVSRQGDWASLMVAICISPPPESPPQASQEFRHFIACCLQRDPAERWTASRLLQHPFVSPNPPSSITGMHPPPLLPVRVQQHSSSSSHVSKNHDVSKNHFHQQFNI